MTRCSRCCLHYSLKILNLIMNFLGIAIIVYSLWLQKKWNIGVAQLVSFPSIPNPCVCSLLFLEIAVIVTIFFKNDWSSLISKYIDENHEYFKNFVVFHDKMCRLITLLILVPQVGVIALAIILWRVGVERISEREQSGIGDFTTSFLVGTGPAILNNSTTILCGRCEVLRLVNPRRPTFFSYLNMLFGMHLQARPFLT
ncbi:tetraspanin-19-like isoform X1 [Gossypium australe]|uniref:Tetraspanin-19-like isoform X1 n=1 Tax=Gossypium australe TaxID=47621 RepID=A0A5B6W7D9_9ROSI|nr:tetraspanin-19-like isoform X1 [Gossypium australe]